MTDRTPCAVLGMALDISDGDPIASCQPLSALVVVKALDAAGDVAYYTAASDGLKSVECLGMAEYAALKLRRGLAADMGGEDDD